MKKLKRRIGTKKLKKNENRDIAPLIKVDSAILIDTTELTIDQVVEKMIELIKFKENL